METETFTRGIGHEWEQNLHLQVQTEETLWLGSAKGIGQGTMTGGQMRGVREVEQREGFSSGNTIGRDWTQLSLLFSLQGFRKSPRDYFSSSPDSLHSLLGKSRGHWRNTDRRMSRKDDPQDKWVSNCFKLCYLASYAFLIQLCHSSSCCVG